MRINDDDDDDEIRGWAGRGGGVAAPKSNSFFLAHVPPFDLEFCENRLSSFCVILLTNKQTIKQTNVDENITSLAEVLKCCDV